MISWDDYRAPLKNPSSTFPSIFFPFLVFPSSISLYLCFCPCSGRGLVLPLSPPSIPSPSSPTYSPSSEPSGLGDAAGSTWGLLFAALVLSSAIGQQQTSARAMKTFQEKHMLHIILSLSIPSSLLLLALAQSQLRKIHQTYIFSTAHKGKISMISQVHFFIFDVYIVHQSSSSDDRPNRTPS